MIKKIDKKLPSFLFIIMKLKQTLNSNIYYCFGNKSDSLSLLRQAKRQIVLEDKIISFSQLVMAEQTHSEDIKTIEGCDLGAGFIKDKDEIPHVDGFITDKENVFIVIKSADCTPILVYAKNKPLVGGCHSGREGTRKGIIKNLIKQMLTDYNLSPSDLVVMIGPAINARNYQVSLEIYNEFIASSKLDQDYRKIDMQKVIINDLIQMGIREENIISSQICTYENMDYNSYRRDKTPERQLSIIGISNGKIH